MRDLLDPSFARDRAPEGCPVLADFLSEEQRKALLVSGSSARACSHYHRSQLVQVAIRAPHGFTVFGCTSV